MLAGGDSFTTGIMESYFFTCENFQSTLEEYMDINPAIENVMIQDSKRLPQVEQPLEFIRQAEIFLN